jgi:transposase
VHAVDLAKAVFQAHDVNILGKPYLRKQLRRGEMLPFFVKLEPCLIGMEACGWAYYWARKLSGMGPYGEVDAPQFLKPYVKTN